MTPTITVFRAMNRRLKLLAALEIGYRYFDLDIGCYWVRLRVSWNAFDICMGQKRSGIGIDWNDKRIEFAPGVVPWKHWKYNFSYVEFE